MRLRPQSFCISTHLVLLHKESRSSSSEIFFCLLVLNLRISKLFCKWGQRSALLPFRKQGYVFEVGTYFSPTCLFSIILQGATPNLALFSRQIKLHCAEPFTDYWTCIDYSSLQLFRRCRTQQAKFDECVLDKLGWVRPDLGELSKVKSHLLAVSPS